MISFTVRMRFDEADRDEIAGWLRVLSEASRQEVGCVSYIAHFVQFEAATVLIYEQYKDEAAVEAHRGTEHFKRYATGGLYTKVRERWVERLDVVE